MGHIKESFNQYKWVLLAGVIVAVLIGVITANFHVLQFMQYKMSNNTEGMVKILQSNVTANNQTEWYFKEGIEYLLEQEPYSEEIKTFFETNFSLFNQETQIEIMHSYNKRKLKLPMSKELMSFLMDARQEEAVKTYIKNMLPEELENGLFLVYGNNPKVDENFVSSFNEFLSNYPQQLPFNKFQFSLCSVLMLSGEQVDTRAKEIFRKIEPNSARSNLFGELKTKEMTEMQLNSMVQLLKDTEIITPNEYNQYETLYSELCVARGQYQGMDEETIALQNKKDSIEAQLSETSNKLQVKKGEITSMQKQLSEVESKLDSLTNYAYIPLYIEGSSGTGSNEYIASIPRGGWFGELKPSSNKYIVKLVGSSYLKEGVYNLNVYLKGSKTTSDGAQYAYYVEVSSSDLSNIEEMTADRDNKLAALNSLKQEADTMTANIDAVKKENNYDEIVEALESVDSRRNEYVNKVNEKIAAIKELFGLSKVNITMDAQ